MDISQINLNGNSSIGLFALATDSYAIFPKKTKKSIIEKAQEILKVPIADTNIGYSHIVGIFGVGNSKNLIFPDFISQEEIENIKSKLPEKINISKIHSKISALGNTIVADDKIALVHNEFDENVIEEIENTLQVEAIKSDLLKEYLVGSTIFKTSKGILAHPKMSQENLDWLAEIFNLKANVTTVNRGTPYPRLGIVGNSQGILVGTDTTGPEMMRIFQVLS